LKTKTKLRLHIALASSLFIISILTPFLEAQWLGGTIIDGRLGPETFWSFKGTFEYWQMGGHNKEEWWFVDYWYRAGIRTSILELWIGPFLIFILEAQVLTVLFSALAIFKVKSSLLLSSTILSIFTTFCMWFISYVLNPEYLRRFEAGFWISIISAALFLVAFLLSWKWLPKAVEEKPQASELLY